MMVPGEVDVLAGALALESTVALMAYMFAGDSDRALAGDAASTGVL